MPTLKWIAMTTLSFYLIALLGMYFLQRQLLYFPRHASKYEVEHNYEFRLNDVVLRGWVINPGKPAAMIFYGGNAERIDYYIQNFKLLFPAHSLYFVNYRGYGESEGKPTEQALYADALAVFDSVKQKHERVDLVGKSLGSGIAVYVAAHRPVHKIALVTPYDSIQNVAKLHYPIFPISLLLKDKYESWKYADKITARTLIVSAQNDKIIPPESTNKLAARFDPKILEVKQITGVDHNSISGESHYYEALADFFSQR